MKFVFTKKFTFWWYILVADNQRLEQPVLLLFVYVLQAHLLHDKLYDIDLSTLDVKSAVEVRPLSCLVSK